MRIASIVGARPQFIKAAVVSKELRKKHEELLIHTGQHYDFQMSRIFFEQMEIPEPAYNLEVGSGNQGWQTGEMLIRLERVLLQEKPDWVLVYGDTNSTLAGALAAAKLHIPVAHVEAGCRSFNRSMPEEINRLLSDHLSSLLFCPTQRAKDNLEKEGILQGVHLVGDVMLDSLLLYMEKANALPPHLGLSPKGYVLFTLHRQENVDDKRRLRSILEEIGKIEHLVIFPIHPRTLKSLKEFGLSLPPNIRLIDPVGYLEMLSLEKNAQGILTDSGGVQKEAFYLQVPCITLRNETEWIETVEAGWNKLWHEGENLEFPSPKSYPLHLFGDGQASRKIAFCFTKMVFRPWG